jgi:mono/diheme cytochrome c family protein
MARDDSTWHIVTVKLAFLLVFVAACEQKPAGGSADGSQIYSSICAACHGPTGKPTDSMIARLNVRDLTSAELRSRVTPELVEKQVRKGSDNKLMPSFEGALTDAQIKAVSAYVASPEFLSPH